MARLNQICIPNYLVSNQVNNSSQYYVRGDGVKSNHHHVSCVLEIAKTTQQTSMFQKMNIWLFGEVKERIHKIWKAQLEGATFFTKLRKPLGSIENFAR